MAHGMAASKPAPRCPRTVARRCRQAPESPGGTVPRPVPPVVRGVRQPMIRPALLPSAMLAALLHIGSAGAVVPASPADCDMPDVARTLVAQPSAAVPATAYWLDARTIRWPGRKLEQGERFRLYQARDGGLRADPGAPVQGANASLALQPVADRLPDALAQRFAFVAAGATLAVDADERDVAELLRGQLLLVREDRRGHVVEAAALQHPGALDALYARAAADTPLGVAVGNDGTRLALWAPTAQQVSVCVYDSPRGDSSALLAANRDDASGIWT